MVVGAAVVVVMELIWQIGPLNPAAQLHAALVELSVTQVPPFKHGFGVQTGPNDFLKNCFLITRFTLQC